MANITELIKKIRSAILGKDVRESIAGAIEQCYEDASKNGNANMEVSEARGNFDTLKKRLDMSDNSINGLTGTLGQYSNNTKKDIDNLQAQINNLVVGAGTDGVSSAEIIQARTNQESNSFATINDRISYIEKTVPFKMEVAENVDFNAYLKPRKIYCYFC